MGKTCHTKYYVTKQTSAMTSKANWFNELVVTTLEIDTNNSQTWKTEIEIFFYLQTCSYKAISTLEN